MSTTLGWRLVNEQMPAEWTVSLGECNELLAAKTGISRDRQDEFAVSSHDLAERAWEEGFYDDLVITVPGADLVRDESIRPGTTGAATGRPEAGVPAHRNHHRRQRLPAQRRRLRRPDRF